MCADVEKCPQQMINVKVTDKQGTMGAESVTLAIQAAEAELGDRGRILLRPSGTEPLVRVMVEGVDEAEVGQHCQALAEVVKSAAGG